MHEEAILTQLRLDIQSHFEKFPYLSLKSDVLQKNIGDPLFALEQLLPNLDIPGLMFDSEKQGLIVDYWWEDGTYPFELQLQQKDFFTQQDVEKLFLLPEHEWSILLHQVDDFYRFIVTNSKDRIYSDYSLGKQILSDDNYSGVYYFDQIAFEYDVDSSDVFEAISKVLELGEAFGNFSEDNKSFINLESYWVEKYKEKIRSLDQELQIVTRLEEMALNPDPQIRISVYEEIDLVEDRITNGVFPDVMNIETNKVIRGLHENALQLRRAGISRVEALLDSLPSREELEKLLERKNMLSKIVKKVKKMPLAEVAEYLHFDDTATLKMWIIDLPDDSPLKIDGEDLIIDTTRPTDSSLNQHIDLLLAKFTD